MLLLLPLMALGAAHAQDGGQTFAGDVLNQALCDKMRDDVFPRIENFTRMKFRRPIPVRIEPRGVWERKLKQSGMGGYGAKHALAYYTPSLNVITIVPWVIGGYARDSGPVKKTKMEWIADLEPTMIHELVHGIHHQNFFSEGRDYAATLMPGGQTEEQLDRATVSFLLGEGVPEFVALRTTEFPQNMHRRPSRDLESAIRFMKKYVPDGKNAYRIKLSTHGYADGLNLVNHLSKYAGDRGIRAMLYRPPPRVLLFQPQLLATVDLDDPPEPDSVFGFLAPEKRLKGLDIDRRVFPGGGGRRLFGYGHITQRAKGCLVGYGTTTGEKDGPYGVGRYAFFVADPDKSAPWIDEMAEALKEINPASADEKLVNLPMQKPAVKATLITVKGDDKSLYVYAKTGGLVVIAHESKPTSNLKERALLGLRALYIKRPKKDLYKEATEKARQALTG
jgi:hypothetical protein